MIMVIESVIVIYSPLLLYIVTRLYVTHVSGLLVFVWYSFPNVTFEGLNGVQYANVNVQEGQVC